MSFLDKEVAFVLSTKKRDLMLSTLELEDMQSNTIDLCTLYSERRERATETLTAMEMDGRIASASLNPEDFAKLAPHVIPLKRLDRRPVRSHPGVCRRGDPHFQCDADALPGAVRRRLSQAGDYCAQIAESQTCLVIAKPSSSRQF